MEWRALARRHARCSQVYNVCHYLLMLPTICVPAAASFEEEKQKLQYSVVAASAACALSLALSLELKAYQHRCASVKYMQLAYDYERGRFDGCNYKALLQEVPELPNCCCGGTALPTEVNDVVLVHTPCSALPGAPTACDASAAKQTGGDAQV